jgi:hypothetical protein
MFDDAAMTLKVTACLQDENKMLVGETDQLRKVTLARVE